MIPVRRRGLIFAGLASDLVMNTLIFVVFVVSVSSTLLWGAIMWWRGPVRHREHLERVPKEPVDNGETPVFPSRMVIKKNLEDGHSTESRKRAASADAQSKSGNSYEPVSGEKPKPVKKHKLSDDGIVLSNDNAKELSVSQLGSSGLRTPVRPETDWQITKKQKSGTPAKQGRRLRQILKPLGGQPGSITTGQQVAVRSFLGRPAPDWMSDRQARVLLSVRYCCEHILLNVMGPHEDAVVDPDVLRRLTVTIVSDQTIRDQVVAWDAHAGLDSNGKPVYRHRDPKTVRLVEGFARKLLEDGTVDTIETSRKSA